MTDSGFENQPPDAEIERGGFQLFDDFAPNTQSAMIRRDIHPFDLRRVGVDFANRTAADRHGFEPAGAGAQRVAGAAGRGWMR